MEWYTTLRFHVFSLTSWEQLRETQRKNKNYQIRAKEPPRNIFNFITIFGHPKFVKPNEYEFSWTPALPVLSLDLVSVAVSVVRVEGHVSRVVDGVVELVRHPRHVRHAQVRVLEYETTISSTIVSVE